MFFSDAVVSINTLDSWACLPCKATLILKIRLNTTASEKNITYPTDAKLAIKIINRLNKLAKHHGIQQRRTYVKEVKNCHLSIRHFRHVKKRAKAKKALTRLTHFKNKIKTFNAYTLPKVYQLGSIVRHTWHIV
jgi:hypothetical protein